MNGGQSGNDAASQAGQEAQLAFLLNAAGQNGLMGLQGAMGGGRFGATDATSLEEQILQRASALRAEALMQQQQQQRQHQLGAALSALQQQQSLQQQQLSSLAGLNPNLGSLGAQEQEAILARAAALRELGIAGVPGSALHGAAGMDRLQQLELGRLEELERRRQQIAALANLGGGARGVDLASGELGPDSIKSGAAEVDRIHSMGADAKSKDELRKTQEDLRKTPGTVIVPCRARGMPMDHNFKVRCI